MWQTCEQVDSCNREVARKIGGYFVTQKAAFSDYVYRNVAGYAPNLHDVDKYDFADKKRPGWYEYDSEWGYRELDDVVAWMPLPEPWSAGSEEKGRLKKKRKEFCKIVIDEIEQELDKESYSGDIIRDQGVRAGYLGALSVIRRHCMD